MPSLIFIALLLQAPPKPAVKQPSQLDKLCRELRTSRQISERVKAAQRIGDLGEKAKERTADLCAALCDKAPAVRQAASEALEDVNPKFQEAVLPIVVDENVDSRIRSIDALRGAELPFKARDAVPALVFRFTFEPVAGPGFDSPSVQKQAVACLKTLAHIAPDDKDVVALMIAASGKSTFPIVRGVALEMIPSLKPEDQAKSIAVLVNALKSDRTENQVVAIQSLVKIGDKGKDVIDVLRKAKGHSNAGVRDAAAQALKKLDK